MVFIAVVAVWCFAAGMQWALGSKAGMVAAATSALLVTAAVALDGRGGVVDGADGYAGCVQAALIAVAALAGQRRADAPTVNGAMPAVAADREPQWTRPACGCGKPCRQRRGSTRWRITVATAGSERTRDTGILRGSDDGVSQCSRRDFSTIANHNRTARRDAEYALARIDAAAAR